MSAVIYPQITEATDSFGRQGMHWKARQQPRRVGLGDEISIHAEATDPIGVGLVWVLSAGASKIASSEGTQFNATFSLNEVAELHVVMLKVTSKWEYHRYGANGYDDETSFSYAVNPPLPSSGDFRT